MIASVRPISASIALVALVLADALGSAPANAQSSEELQGIEQQLQAEAAKAEALSHKAEALGGEIDDLRAALVVGAKAVQDSEQQVSEVEAALAELEDEVGTRSEELASQRLALGRVLMALERMSRRPMLAMFFTDRPPVAEARAQRLLAIAGTTLNRRASALVAELSELDQLRARVAARRAELAEAIGKLADENKKLTALLQKKSKLQARTREEGETMRQRMANLSDEARNLKDLLDRLEAAKESEPPSVSPAPPDPTQTEIAGLPNSRQAEEASPADPQGSARPLPEAGNPLVQPVRGKIAAGFGQSTEALGESTGLVFAARGGAEVVAPFDGQVVFQGPFRGYGQILIIEHAGGYHSVLAGLDRADVSVGQWLLAGEPVGSMAGDSGGSRLYFELRHDGQPVDPAPWLDPSSWD